MPDVDPEFEDALGPEPADEEPPAPTIEAARFRQVLGHYPTGVTVITALEEGRPYGLAANSFTSLSLDPPLVSFSAAHTSTTWPHIRRAGHFCVNVLGEDQEELCRLFAMRRIGTPSGRSAAASARGGRYADHARAESQRGSHRVLTPG